MVVWRSEVHMLVYLFPILLPVGLIGLIALCLAARAAMRRAEDPSVGRGALLMALTRVPVAIQPKPGDEKPVENT